MNLNDLPFLEPHYIIGAVIALIITGGISHFLKGITRKLFLIVLSILIVFYIDPISATVLLIFSQIAWLLLTFYIQKTSTIRAFAWLGVVVLLGFKAIQIYFFQGQPLGAIRLIGVSYFTFRICSTLFDGSRAGKFENSYIDYILYCFFFPIFTGGPIERLRNFERNSASYLENLFEGLKRISFGIFKKLFIADLLLMEIGHYLQDYANMMPEDAIRPSVFPGDPQYAGVALLLYGFVSILRAYMDLSAFTDFAVGLSRILGYSISENFNWPLKSTNLIDFWRRWHMTIAGWAKDYIFSPLLIGTRRIGLSIVLTMLFMGIWHAPSLQWILWGLGHGFGMLAFGAWERTKLRNSILQKAKNVKLTWLMVTIAWLINFTYMSMIFLFVSTSSLSRAFEMQRQIIGF